ncbi:probable LRR receptor-like serine/threonine-protein kinase At1g06840 [Rutidosis leptorrhynchoides]|uniref:probable LRR receptor-like serine/threonine-protein kinase At1g06840 n=1 Tax=Rutidosis leptorrhynchoides TaxID=125765 RepID=UPI003A994709
MVGFNSESCGSLKMMGFKFKSCGCVLSLFFMLLVMSAAAKVTDPSEVSALLAVRGSLADPMNHLSNWNKGDPCTSNWTGVICAHKNKVDKYWHVQEIQLLNMNLSGHLAPELGQFSHLTILDFMWNNLTGSIPKEIGNISSLVLLLLNGNRLSGSLPDELGYLRNLNRFQIDQNHVSGSIPKSFSNLINIKHIHFNNNSLSGQIPYELSNLSTLMHLLLDNNNLTGYLPSELGNLLNMRILQLDNNNFNGEIPSSYGNLSALVKISLRNCSLQGVLPDLSRIPFLSYIDLSRNSLTGSIPSNKLSDSMTTIDLSDNQLDGSIPEMISDLPTLQKLSLENNFFNGSISSELWQNKSFRATSRLLLDFRNNSFSNIIGALNPPVNASLRLNGNPICRNSSIQNKDQFCEFTDYGDYARNVSTNSNACPMQSCPTDNYFEYVPGSPISCFCASPIRIGYRLKSPSFSYFRPYEEQFEMYVTSYLGLDSYQLFIDSITWEKGPRLRMYLKLFPKAGTEHSGTFSTSDVLRIRGIFTTWVFPGSNLFGPYELLNFTLVGPYSHLNVATPGKGVSKGVVITVVIVAVICALLVSSILTVLIKKQQEKYKQNSSRKSLLSKLSINMDGVKSFTYREMAIATENFDKSSLVGRGGYGKVYKGNLSNNITVAIKRAEVGSLQGEKEFLTEIEMLSRLHHRNLVSLVGYCDEEEEQMLVYEFMPQGTLRDWLNAKTGESLSFRKRLNVALDSAKGILYLHTEADPPIFHRDIKSSNILLDSKLTAKVADFGLSRLAPILDDNGVGPNYVSTIVRGTPGYLDPEYLLTHKLTDKSDVYSLGVVLMEILTSMKPISHGKNIVREVKIAHESGTVFSIIDNRMGSYPSECIEKFVSLALWCCKDKPENRPSMLAVVRELERILENMPETGFDFSQPESKRFVESSSSSLLLYSSSNVPGTDLSSDANPVVNPR